MQVTSLEQLKNIKITDIVDLGPFEDGTNLIAEVKKPNLMQLMVEGKVPNTLMPTAMGMFKNGSGELVNKAIDDVDSLKDLVGMMEVFAEASLVNPSYSQMKEIGLSLTENQLIGILQFAQGGVKALENFRMQSEHNTDIESK